MRSTGERVDIEFDSLQRCAAGMKKGRREMAQPRATRTFTERGEEWDRSDPGVQNGVLGSLQREEA
jgi:hypothetical protein